MAIKDDYIKVRVSKEQKKLFKRVAELKGITLTELLVGGTEERALREINKIECAESLEERVAEVEKKLQEIKLKLESQSSKKKSLLKNFFYDIIKYRFIGRYSRMASYKKGIGTTQNQLKHECSNRATATEKI